MNDQEKQAELKKYRDLVIATLDYCLETKILIIKTSDFDGEEHFNQLKQETEEHFQKGRLTLLKIWFSNMSEPLREIKDLNFRKYLIEKTSHNVDIFKSYFERVDKIIARGKITTPHQYNDLKMLLVRLWQMEPKDNDRIVKIHQLLLKYEQKS